MLKRQRFARGSGVFACRHCGRQTRAVDGNEIFGLCPDCSSGLEQENGANDTSDPELKAQYRRDADACFQAAVNKGGSIDGYSKEV